jgi:alkanesulfonate monooxygenase SsuD/methylene tetrahydromethanopterin reductase-like flavin-dependent oxidoreductase (luciferase family)
VLHVGSKRAYGKIAHHNIHFGASWRRTFDEVIRDGMLMSDPSLLVTNPSPKTYYVLAPAPNLAAGPLDWRGDLAARYADEFNMPFASAEETRAQFDRVRSACVAAGRDPAALRWSAAIVLCCGRDEAEVRRRAAAIGRDPEDLRKRGVAGTPAECVDTLGRYAAAGVQRVYLQTLDMADLDHIELVAGQVAPQLP